MKRAQFLACYDQGLKSFSRHFILFARDNPTPDAPWRLGVAVSRKLGCAVKRNRIKRLLREFFRLHQQALPTGVDFVVIPKRHVDAKKLKLTQIQEELPKLINRSRHDNGHTVGAAPHNR